MNLNPNNKIDISNLNKTKEIELSREEKLEKIKQLKEYRRLSETEQKLLSFLLNQIPDFASEVTNLAIDSISKRINMEYKTIQAIMKRLTNKKIIIKERVSRFCAYDMQPLFSLIGQQGF